jgi:isopropylmalate/homocitrate/citramalate synthase
MTLSRSIMSNVEAILVKLDNLTRRAMKSASTGGEAIAIRAMHVILAMWDTRRDQVLKTTPQEVQEKIVKMVLLVVTLPGVDAISSTTITTSTTAPRIKSRTEVDRLCRDRAAGGSNVDLAPDVTGSSIALTFTPPRIFPSSTGTRDS